MEVTELLSQNQQQKEDILLLQEELAQANKGLVALSMELEDRVDRRTAEFIDSNQQLKKEISLHKEAKRLVEETAKFPRQNPNPVMRISKGGAFLFGNTASAIIQEKWGISISGEINVEWRDIIVKIFREGNREELELEYDGMAFLLEFVPIMESGYVNIYGTDITKRKLAEKKIEYEQYLMRTLMENSPDYIYFKDTSCRFIRANNATARRFGLSASDELTGKSDYDFFSAEHGEKMYEIESEIMSTGKPLIGHDEREVWPDGTETTWVSSTKVRLEGPEGDVIGIFGITRDITERKKYEERIQGLNEELEERVGERTRELQAVNGELESFAYSVSHDLQAPLRSIDGFSQALLEEYDDKLDDTGRDYLHRVRRASQKMGILIDELLSFSRLTRRDMKTENVDLSAMAEEIISELRRGEPGRDVECMVTENITVTGDRHLLAVVMENLLSNAWKFTGRRECATIEFGTVHDNTKKVYFVRDNGAGFNMEYANKLFLPFQRLHKTDEFPGNGIGLANVQRIVDRHGGIIWVEAEEDKGAIFYFTLGQ